MSFSVNHVMFGGNLTRDPETNVTPNGTTICNCGLAVNERKKEGDKWVDDPIFMDITLFGKTAERFQNMFKKGDSVLVIGRIQRDKWEKDGQKRQKDKVIVNEFEGSRYGKDRAAKPSDQNDIPEPPF